MLALSLTLLLASSSFGSIPLQLLTPEASATLLSWMERPAMFVTFQDVAPELSFTIKRCISNLGYTPIEDTAPSGLKELIRTVADTTSHAPKTGATGTDVAEVISRNQKYLVFFQDETGLSILDEEREVVIPRSAINLENIHITLKGLVDPATSSVTPPTIFLGAEGKVRLIRNYGTPYVENSNVDYLGGWLEDGTSPESVALHTSLGKTFYLNRVIQNDRNRVLLDRTRILCFWDGIIIYSDGHISDMSLNWRMKVSAAAPLDFYIGDGILYLLDVAGNVYAVNLKNRRVLLNDKVESAVAISVVDKKLQVVTLRGTIAYSPDFAKKENRSALAGEGTEIQTEIQRSSYFSKTALLSPTALKIHLTPFGIFWRDTYLGQELHLLRINENKAQVFTELGVWVVPLNAENLP